MCVVHTYGFMYIYEYVYTHTHIYIYMVYGMVYGMAYISNGMSAWGYGKVFQLLNLERLCIRVLQRNRTGCVCVPISILPACLSIYLSIYLSNCLGYFQELAHTVVEAGKFNICRVGWQAGGPEKNCSLSPKVSAGRIPSCVGRSVFFH